MDRKKVLELDKICRVCISERKEMRPLFNEKVAEMLMECTSVTIEPTEGWPDKICVQCVHSVSRCHAFKALVERSDKELREYVKSLTVRVVIENPQEQKMQQLQQKQAKLLQLQQQQQVLLAQHQEHQKLQLEQQERQQQKQQKILQKQLQQKQRQLQEGKQQLLQQQQYHEQKQKQQQQKQNMQLQQQQNLHHKKKTSPRKTSRPTKKQQTLHQQQPQPVAIHSVSNASTQIVATISRQQQQHASQLLPATAALPQQIVLPSGQVITTAQIVTHSGPPQIAQIYNNNSTPTTSSLQQLAPHIIQSANGQTLQLIQQSNGQQTLQLVQLVPQQQPRKASIVEINDINEQQATSRLDHHLVDHDDLDEDQLECNAIVIKEEELHTQPLLATVEEEYDEQLSQGETQEFEYLEDITVTTTAHQQLGDGLDDDEISQHHQHLLPVSGEDEDIIEEIHMEEELLEDVEEDDVDVHHEMHVMNAEEDVEFDHNLMDEELQYTVIEYSDEIAEEVEQEANPASAQPQINLSISEGSTTPTCSISNVSSTYKKTSARKSTKSSVPASRTLPSTASTIATAGTNEDFQMDQKFIAEFISQQTTSLGAGRYVCNLCRQEFKHFKGLQNHMHSHSNWIRANCKKQPQCDICLKSFKGPGMLKMHMKTHQSAAKTPVCNICQKVFKSKAILYRHRQTHQLRSYSCGIEMCRKTFSTHPNLRMHMTKKHPNEAQPKYKCGECASLFDDVDVLHAHVNSHGRGEEENVTISGEILAESDLLTLHSGHQVKLDGMVTMSDVIVVT